MLVLKHYTIYIKSLNQFKSYVVIAQSDAVKELEDTLATQYKQQQDKNCKGNKPLISKLQLASTAQLIHLYASWPVLTQVKAKQKSNNQTSKVNKGLNKALRFTSKQILSKKWDKLTNKNPLQSHYQYIISQSPKLQQLSNLLDILDKHQPDNKLLIASDFPITYIIISLISYYVTQAISCQLVLTRNIVTIQALQIKVHQRCIVTFQVNCKAAFRTLQSP